jgi:hypothetical protein
MVTTHCNRGIMNGKHAASFNMARAHSNLARSKVWALSDGIFYDSMGSRLFHGLQRSACG